MQRFPHNPGTEYFLMDKGGSGHSVDSIASFLQEARLPFGYEKDVKRHIREALDKAGIPYRSNVRLAKGTFVSFLIAGSIAVCCYIDASMSRIVSQMDRFARSNSVDGVIVVTSRDFHLGSGYLGGKPALVVKPSRSWMLS